MCEAQQFCLKWNSFPNSMISALEILKDDEDFVDVTLACNGKSFKAHKVILSACSQYFHSLLKDNPCQHPIVILQDVGAEELGALLQFMYHGQANIEQQLLPKLLQAASSLQIKGLSEISQQAKEVGRVAPCSVHICL